MADHLHEEEVLGKAYDSRLMRRLLGYMRPYRGLVALSLFFLLAQSALQVLGPMLTSIAVDKYLQRQADDRTFDVVTLRDGLIVGMHACRDRTEARSLAGIS